MQTTHKFGFWLNTGLLIIGALIMIFPLLWLLSTAFKPEVSAFNGQLIPTNPTFDNFRQILTPNSAAAVPRWLLNSLIVSIVASLLVVLVDLLAAYALARLHFFGSKVLLYLVIVSLVVPFIALLIPLYLEFAGMNSARHLLGAHSALQFQWLWCFPTLSVLQGYSSRSGGSSDYRWSQ